MKYKVNLNCKITLRGQMHKDKPLILTFDNLPKELIQENSYGVPCSEWLEPIDIDPSTMWGKYLLDKYEELPFEPSFLGCVTPVIGMMFNGHVWEQIKGYKPPTFAPGLSWEDEVIPKF